MECPNYFWPWFSGEEYERRYANIRAAMEKKGLGALVVYGVSRSMNMDPGQTNIVYLASVASAGQTFIVFPLEGEPTMFIMYKNHVKNTKAMSPIRDVRAGGTFFEAGGMTHAPRRVAERLKELGLENRRIGIMGESAWLGIHLPHEAHETITGALPGAEFEVLTSWYEELRLIKSDEEIALMRRVAAMTDAAYEVMVRAVRPGVRPCDLYNDLVRASVDMGGRVCLGHVGRTPMSDPDMNYPHYYPLTTPIRAGDAVMTEVAVGTAGYSGKIWGTFFVGDPTPEYEEMFRLAVKTSDVIAAAIRPGVRTGDLTRLCPDTIQDAGYMAKTSICGWSNRNARPDVRGDGDRITDPDFIFEKNQCINVVGWPSDHDETRGVWLGDCCIVHREGIENPQQYPIREIHVAG